MKKVSIKYQKPYKLIAWNYPIVRVNGNKIGELNEIKNSLQAELSSNEVKVQVYLKKAISSSKRTFIIENDQLDLLIKANYNSWLLMILCLIFLAVLLISDSEIWLFSTNSPTLLILIIYPIFIYPLFAFKIQKLPNENN